MKKTTTLMFALVISTTVFANKDYYQASIGLNGFALKTKLKEIISKGHRDQGYGALYDYYFESDADHTYDGDGSVVDMYSENPNGSDPYVFSNRKDQCGNYRKESDCFNREHLFPQSIFNKRSPMRSDFFQVYPTDGMVNNRRGSLPFGEVAHAQWTSLNGSKVGNNTTPGYSGRVFEPIDEFKGDIARALLYFGTRYEDKIGGWNHAMLSHDNHTAYANWFVKVLLKWHKMDPVSQHEKTRNEYGFKFQGNRNPYIDHPEFVEKIWK